jgi:hypothetical protein
MISLSSLIVFHLLFIGFMLTGEFTSLDEPTDVFEVAVIAVFLADGPKFTGSKRWVEPRDPTQS